MTIEDPVYEHELDRLRTHLSLHQAALKASGVAEGRATQAMDQVVRVSDRVAVQEHRSHTLDVRLDKIESKVDSVHVQLGRLVDRTPGDRLLMRSALGAITLGFGTLGLWALLQLLERLGSG